LAIVILVTEETAGKLKAFAESEGIPLEIVREGPAELRVVCSQERVESTGSTLHIGGWMRCPVARETAARLGMDPKQFGRLLDILDIKIRDCELGCF